MRQMSPQKTALLLQKLVDFHVALKPNQQQQTKPRRTENSNSNSNKDNDNDTEYAVILLQMPKNILKR